MDESTDISKIQILIIVANLVKNGHCTLVFLDAIELASATSEALLEALEKTVFQEYGVTTTQFCGLNTDGASALSGEKSGLQALLKEKYKGIVWFHCAAHRLQLAIKNELKEDSDYEKIESKFQHLRKLIHDSSKS